jgi:sugar lactone lactonase YvrE
VASLLQGLEIHDLGRVLPDGIGLDAEGAVWVASPWGDVGIPRVLEGSDFTDQVKTDTQYRLP